MSKQTTKPKRYIFIVTVDGSKRMAKHVNNEVAALIENLKDGARFVSDYVSVSWVERVNK